VILYSPDTNTISLLARRDPQVMQRFMDAEKAGHQFVLCPLVEYEIRRGLAWRPLPLQKERIDEVFAHFHRVEFYGSIWRRGAEFWAHSRRVGEPLPDADILIAAHAMELSAVLVTNNERHFRLFEPLGLQLENWAEPAP
jgi:predicted nucleic acid-binding protein